jgi:glutamyl-Q tRNA(Asp) synthetase
LFSTVPTYTGRFAPSPTGPLHLGSLLAAVASFIDARHNRGRWLVRIEDVDGPRVVRGAADRILRTLEAHGLHWDEPPILQSARTAAYESALDALAAQGHVFYCQCSRRELRGLPTYPGRCRGVRQAPPRSHAIRLHVPAGRLSFEDLVQGWFSQRVDEAVGDFVLRRRDGIYAYQLAVVVDDAWQGVTRVVRGADLLDNTPRQMLLADRLQLSKLEYAHVPIIVDRNGAKLSKQTLATAVDDRAAGPNLYTALELLGQAPPPELQREPASTLLDWARANWQLTCVPRQPSLSSFIAL